MGAGESPWSLWECHCKLSKRQELILVILPVSMLNRLEGE